MTKKLNIPCVILAGGKSSRMGEDKCFLSFKDTTLIEYQYRRLKKIFSQVYISAKNNKFDFACDIIYDKTDDISSPMVALKSILENIDDKVFIITVDTPLIQEQTINTLLDNSKNYDITVAQDKEKTHTLLGVYSKTILPTIKQCLDDDIHKINYLIKQTNFKTILFDDKKQFLNLNTQDDYKIAVS